MVSINPLAIGPSAPETNPSGIAMIDIFVTPFFSLFPFNLILERADRLDITA